MPILIMNQRLPFNGLKNRIMNISELENLHRRSCLLRLLVQRILVAFCYLGESIKTKLAVDAVLIKEVAKIV